MALMSTTFFGCQKKNYGDAGKAYRSISKDPGVHQSILAPTVSSWQSFRSTLASSRLPAKIIPTAQHARWKLVRKTSRETSEYLQTVLQVLNLYPVMRKQ